MGDAEAVRAFFEPFAQPAKPGWWHEHDPTLIGSFEAVADGGGWLVSLDMVTAGHILFMCDHVDVNPETLP